MALDHVIVGAGPAGVIAAETLRRIAPQDQVLLVHGEGGEPYARMALPYYLTGKIDAAGTRIRKVANHYQAVGIEVRHGWVEAVAPEEGLITLVGGDRISFDRLLLATGSTPIRPPIPGLDLPGVHPCWTLDDARAIARLATRGAHVVLMGAGFIGCIILEALAERGVLLTVVEMNDRMVPRMMNAAAGGLLKAWCEARGVRVRTSTRITGIEAASRVVGQNDSLWVHLDGGEPLSAQLVVIATGVRANMDVLEGSGIGTDQGVLVDRFLRTSRPKVFAAGDVAQGPDFSTQGFSVHAVQPTAAEHGRIAALNMAGRTAPFQGSLVMNVLDTLGLVSVSIGRWQGVADGDGAERDDPGAYRYINLQFNEDRLVGAISLGRTDWIGVLRGLIQGRIRLGPWKDKLKIDPNRIAEAYIARTGV